ncbi:MAG: copper homeostasis protein CutC [Eudoraea sp.]|nr:copper homeostasis protein CutC [Eudoraea sp.]
MIVEICANSLQSALYAESGGADRIELCSELGVGGLTPSYGLLKKIKEHIKIPVHVLIRPRSGDFTYSDFEFQIMKEDIALCVELGFDGIVSGVLQKNLEVDWERTEELMKAARSLKFTFHRAFDWVPAPMVTFTKLQDLGVSAVLTSGKARSATSGMSLLQELNKTSTTCIVMPGAGIRDANAASFKEAGFKAIHLSATHFIDNLETVPPLPMNSPEFLLENKVAITNLEMVEKVIKIVK